MHSIATRSLWVAVALAALAASCGGTTPCVAGEVATCTCSDASPGLRTCTAQGTLSQCSCNPGAGGGGGKAKDGGSGGGTGGGGGAGGGGTVTGPATVTGVVTYDFVPSVYVPATTLGTLDFAHATQKPARGIVIQVVQGGTTLGTAVTGDDGHFSVAFTSATGGALTLFALARTSTPAIQVQDNTSGGAVWGLSTALTGADQVVTLRATHGWGGSSYVAAQRQAAPFAILDSMLTASRAFLAARPALVFPPLKCNWSPNNIPQDGDPARGQIGTSSYDSGSNQIFILGQDQVDTDEFDSHVIVHEWGHFFEANFSRSDSPGGRHGSGDLADPRLAFGEGWGDAVASMVLPETTYSDTLWDLATKVLGGFGFDLETEPGLDHQGHVADDPNPGFWSESSVMRFLYDAFDPANESFDGVALGLGPIIDVLTGPERTTVALTTVASFLTGLKATPEGGAVTAGLDTLAAHYRIGPITTIWGDGDTTLRAMYLDVGSVPFTSSGLTLAGGPATNSYQQNRYFVFQGPGRSVTISTASSQSLELVVYQAGVPKASTSGSGSLSLTLAATAGLTYVGVLTGTGPSGTSPVTVKIQ